MKKEWTGELEFEEIILGETTRLRASLKTFDGRLFLDVRKWIKYPTIQEFRATSKGIMISIEDWKRAMEMINKVIDGKALSNI